MNLIKDKGVKYITFGWLGFIAENIVVSHNREYINIYIHFAHQWQQYQFFMDILNMQEIKAHLYSQNYQINKN